VGANSHLKVSLKHDSFCCVKCCQIEQHDCSSTMIPASFILFQKNDNNNMQKRKPNPVCFYLNLIYFYFWNWHATALIFLKMTVIELHLQSTLVQSWRQSWRQASNSAWVCWKATQNMCLSPCNSIEWHLMEHWVSNTEDSREIHSTSSTEADNSQFF